MNLKLILKEIIAEHGTDILWDKNGEYLNPCDYPIEKWLKENKYDGLYSIEDEPCGCENDDLFPCDDPHGDNCCAGYYVPIIDGDEKIGIGPKKEEAKEVSDET